MKDYVKASLRKKPELFILHVGKKRFRQQGSPELIAKSIIDVVCSLKSESHNVSVSSLLLCNGKFKAKVAKSTET